MAIKAADMLIARRADTRARADFATWKMMAKLNGASSLPAEAQTFLESYKTLLKEMAEPEATEATINLIYRNYYGEMGGAGAPPDPPTRSTQARPAPACARSRDNKTQASRRPDICLPCRRLCRHQISAAVMVAGFNGIRKRPR